MDEATFQGLAVAALLTREGFVVGANQAYERMMGIAASAVVGRAIQELVVERIDPPDVDVVAQAATSRSEGRAKEGEIWCQVLDGRGRRRAVRALWGPSPVDPGTNVVLLLDDGGATAAKEAAEAFARAGSELYRAVDEQSVLEQAADALAAQGFVATFLLIDPDDAYLRYGPSRSPRPGGPRSFEAARLPRTVLERINPRFHEGRAIFLQNVQRTVDDTYAPEVARTIEEANPGRFAVQAPLFVDGAAYSAMVITSSALSPALAGAVEVFAVLVARAIENVRLRVRQLESERLAAIGEAAAVMAHEVRNPVATLLNAATLLRRGDGVSDDLVAMIVHEAQTLEHVVLDLLALGRPLTPRISDEDLRTPASGALALALRRHPETPVVLHADAPIAAAIDPDLVQIAISNLLRNAQEASPPGATVDLFVELVDGAPTVRVEDRGPGIPPALSQRVLEPFFTTRPAGTGIGLAAVRRIVEACGGSIGVGTADGGGARVVLRFRGGEA